MTNNSDDAPILLPFPGSDRAPVTVKIPLAQLVPLLLDAILNERAWIDDFADDDVTVSSDLYEVLRLYAHRRNAA